MLSVRDQLFDFLRQLELTTIFANPGSTEVALLADLPDDINFVLALHENSVVGMAAGHALATARPSLVLLHTTAGLGNAVGAIATARTNRAPMVIIVGQQDRRHLASEPFLAGHLDGLAGDYPVSVRTPSCAQAIPGAVRRAFHEAVLQRGPAVVIAPMGDWSEPAEEASLAAAPLEVRRSQAADPRTGAELARRLEAARRPAIVTGPEADTAACRDALAVLADKIDAQVWQGMAASQAGFPHDNPRFRGHLPQFRPQLREALADHDLVLVVGGPAFRQGTYRPGPFVEPGTEVVVVSNDFDVVTYSSADLAVFGDPENVIVDLARRIAPRQVAAAPSARDLSHLVPPLVGPLRAEHVFAAVADRLPAESTVLEESPSTRRTMIDLMPARSQLGFVTIAQGGLGFVLPAAAGIKLARPDRPVVAMIGDGASLYGIQALWSATHYGLGVLYVILNNGGYAIMDALAADQGGKAPWPGFSEIDPGLIARGFGCPSIRIDGHADLVSALDEIVPHLGARTEPVLLDVRVASTRT